MLGQKVHKLDQSELIAALEPTSHMPIRNSQITFVLEKNGIHSSYGHIKSQEQTNLASIVGRTVGVPNLLPTRRTWDRSLVGSAGRVGYCTYCGLKTSVTNERAKSRN
jgi:hypothetical protein